MSTKIITLEERFYTGEPTVQLVSTLGRDGRALREKTSLHMSKTAGQSPAMDFIRNVQPEPGKTIVLVIGLGDHETYGPNRNGDGFPSESVPGKISSDQVLTKHFQSYDNAHVFEHHVNHDPEKAIGKVIKAFWNPHMRRVEVLESFDHDKAPHLLEKITSGQYPSKSMGCAPAGTPIHTPEGIRAIEDIKLGDRVLTHTGQAHRVTELHRRHYEGDLYTVTTASGKSTMTSEHPYAILPSEATDDISVVSISTAHVHWVPARDLRPGMRVFTPSAATPFETVTDVLRLAFSGMVYNFEVDTDNSYVAGNHAVHNCKIPYDVCFPAGTLVRTENGQIPIEEITVGMRVTTHTGALREVTETFIHADDQGRVTLEGVGVPPLTCTPAHPIYVLREIDVRTCAGSANGKRLRHQTRPGSDSCARCGASLDALLTKAQWIAAEDVRPGDYLLSPLPAAAAISEPPSDARARLLGYYLGDGHVLTERRGADRSGELYVTGFGVTCATTENEHLGLLQETCAAAALKNPARTYAQSGKAAVQVLVHDQPFTHWLIDTAGRGSRGKRLAEDVYGWPESARLELLAGYVDTDGSGNASGIRIATVNRGLALDVQRLCHGLGMLASVTYAGASKGGYAAVGTEVWYVYLPAGQCEALRARSVRARKVPAKPWQSSQSFFLGSYWVTPVRAVTHAEGEGRVYNFSVEGDESYLVEGVAVHNCTVCGNKAATRAEYCDHLKYEMGRIYPDGKQAAALNPSPRFFDSSWVIRPADRTGHMLKKVARDAAYELRLPSYELADLVENARHKAAALGKAADMEKVVTGMPEASATSTDKGTLKLIKRYSDEMAPQEAASLPKTDVRITIEYTPDEAIGTTDAMGLPMGIKELVQYFMGRAGAEGAPSPSDLDCACKHAEALFEIFSEYPRFYDDVLKVAGLVEPRVNEKLANAVWPPATMVQDRALVDTPLYDRRIPALPQMSSSPNTDVLTFTDPSGHTYRTNMGMARRATNALEADAQGKKYMRGAGYLGLGALLGTAGAGALLTGKRTAMRSLLGGGAIGGGAALGFKGLHEAARPVRMGDLSGPKVMTNEGHVIPAYTEMKAASWRPEMLYTVLRHRDGDAACAALEPQRKLAFQAAVRRAEVHDDLSAVLGPTLELEKVALLLEQSISALA